MEKMYQVVKRVKELNVTLDENVERSGVKTNHIFTELPLPWYQISGAYDASNFFDETPSTKTKQMMASLLKGIDPYTEPNIKIAHAQNRVILEGWQGGKQTFHITFEISPSEEKYYDTTSSTGEPMAVIAPDHIDNLIDEIEEIIEKVFEGSSDENLEDCVIAQGKDPKTGPNAFFSFEPGCAYLKAFKDGQETVFETFDTEAKLSDFHYALEVALEQATKDESEEK